MNIYGYLVTYEKSCGYRTERETFRHKGSQYSARAAATFKQDFVRIVWVEPLTEMEWENRFGAGRKVELGKAEKLLKK